jgi:hypothetical protein
MKFHKSLFFVILQIIDILKNCYRERRREEICKNAEKTLQEYRKGLTKSGILTPEN